MNALEISLILNKMIRNVKDVSCNMIVNSMKNGIIIDKKVNK